MANNSSGMCCGVSQNTYHTLRDMRIVFVDGTGEAILPVDCPSGKFVSLQDGFEWPLQHLSCWKLTLASHSAAAAHAKRALAMSLPRRCSAGYR